MDNALYHILFREKHLTLYSNLQQGLRSRLVVVVLMPSRYRFKLKAREIQDESK